jgi:hypothetical protein
LRGTRLFSKKQSNVPLCGDKRSVIHFGASRLLTTNCDFASLSGISFDATFGESSNLGAALIVRK